ncbi:MAG: CHASE domain-containing protein [Burkholderiales bacterium]
MQPPAIVKRALEIFRPRGRPYDPLVIAVAVLLPVALTFFAWRTALDAANQDARSRFEVRTGQMAEAIKGRLLAYEQVLRGAAGLFAASDNVRRSDWRAYFENLGIDTRYPGIQGIGFGQRVPHEERQTHVQTIRAEGFPAYDIRPDGRRDEYVPVVFLEPFLGRNLRAFGFDMYSEAVRRAAMDQARDSGKTALSGKVTLTQETDSAVQHGFLMYIPVYRKGRDLASVEQRRSALTGYVYGAFRMDDLIRGILADEHEQGIALAIYDGAGTGAAALLYDSLRDRGGERRRAEPLFRAAVSIVFRDHPWTLRMASLPAFEDTVEKDKPRLVLYGGIALDLLFFAVIWSLWQTRQRALRLARSMSAEARARQAELEAMNDASPLGIFRIDTAGNCVYVNRAYETISGLSIMQALGHGWTRAVHPDDRERVLGQWNDAVCNHRPYESTHRFLRPDGSVIWVSVKAAAIREEGKLLGYTGSVEDITRHRESMEALRESREQLSLALEGSNLALFDWDLGSGRVHLSERWQEIVGGERRPTVTTIEELQALVHPEDLPALQQKLREVLKGAIRYYQVEHRVRCRNGEWKWILSRAKVAQRDGSGHALRITGTNADISASKEIDRLKNEFIATVSHELRTPLTGIIGALSLMREDSRALSGESAMFLDMAYQNSERLASLINDFLYLEKIESGQMEFRIEPVDVAAVLEKAVRLNTAYAERLDVQLQLQKPLPTARVRADVERLIQVLTNLLSNAAKFSPAGMAVEISAAVRDSTVRFAIRDHGPGVPSDFRDRIFQKFAQADGSDTRQRGGTGLGLSICKVIVEKMNGSIGFESAPGQGATFYFDLPLAPQTADA